MHTLNAARAFLGIQQSELYLDRKSEQKQLDRIRSLNHEAQIEAERYSLRLSKQKEISAKAEKCARVHCPGNGNCSCVAVAEG